MLRSTCLALCAGSLVAALAQVSHGQESPSILDYLGDRAAQLADQLPAIRWTAWLCGWFRVFQQGSIQAYLLYIVLTLLVLLFWW